jgi:hypothetical protein
MRFVRDLSSRRAAGRKPASPRLGVEALESRNLLSGYTLDPLVQVSGASLLAGSPLEGITLANSESEPQLAVDPRNPDHLVGLWHQDIRLDIDSFLGVVAGASFDGGKHWQLTVLPGTEEATGGFLPGGGDPWVSFAPNGDVYASVLAYDVPGGFDTAVRSQILVSQSTDGGLSWGAPTVVIDDVPQRPNIAIFNDKDSITADPNDPRFAYDAWDRIQVPPGLIGGKGVLTFARTTDDGQTWEPARAIYDPGTNHAVQAPQIIVMPDRSLRLFFSELTLTVTPKGDVKNKDTLKVMSSTDHGQTWSAPVAIAAMKGVEVFDPDNGTFVTTNSSPGEGIVIPIFDVAVDPHNGNLYTVWEDGRFNGGQYNRIAFSQSTDGGRTWSDPVPLNQTPTSVPAADRSAFIPSIAVAADGTVAVTYYDFRANDAAPGLPTDYWVVFGTPAGGKGLAGPRAWGNELRLSDHPANLELTDTFDSLFVGDYQGLSAVGNDFLALFGQAVSSDDPSSIFFRRIVGTPGEVSPGFTSSSVGTLVTVGGTIQFTSGERTAPASTLPPPLGLAAQGGLDLVGGPADFPSSLPAPGRASVPAQGQGSLALQHRFQANPPENPLAWTAKGLHHAKGKHGLSDEASGPLTRVELADGIFSAVEPVS